MSKRKVAHTFRNGVECFDPRPIVWANSEDCMHDDSEARQPVHTIGGKPIGPSNPGAYGRTHDMTCPGCADTPYTASPRSETYWSS